MQLLVVVVVNSSLSNYRVDFTTKFNQVTSYVSFKTINSLMVSLFIFTVIQTLIDLVITAIIMETNSSQQPITI